MRWQRGRRSQNVEDIRTSGRPAGQRGLALGGGGSILFILVLVLFGVDPMDAIQLLASSPQASVQSPRPAMNTPEEDTSADFVSVVLADTEDAWTKLFAESRLRYQAPKLVLFRGAVDSACGYAQAAAGPFYCPANQKVYLDLSFLSELKRLGAKGDFAFAYVIGHEVAHHVQNLLGTLSQVQSLKQRASTLEANALQVRVELQADCLAGVWAFHGNKDRKILEPGDIEEGLQAAASVGDDTLQRRAGRRIRPESFTHGSAKQRSSWFMKGFREGSVEACDTFRA